MDTFVLLGKAKDSKQTLMTITPDGVLTSVSVTFTVDTIPGPSLRLTPQRIDVETGDEFHLELIAEEVIDLMGVKAVFQFDPDKLSILDIQEGGFLSSSRGRISRYHIIDESLGCLKSISKRLPVRPRGLLVMEQ